MWMMYDFRKVKGGVGESLWNWLGSMSRFVDLGDIAWLNCGGLHVFTCAGNVTNSHFYLRPLHNGRQKQNHLLYISLINALNESKLASHSSFPSPSAHFAIFSKPSKSSLILPSFVVPSRTVTPCRPITRAYIATALLVDTACANLITTSLVIISGLPVKVQKL